MKRREKAFSEFNMIEREFFEIDKEARQVLLHLHFESPKEIFDAGCRSQTPIFNDDFAEWVYAPFNMIPAK